MSNDTYKSIYELPVLNYDRFIATRDVKWLEPDRQKKDGVNYEEIWQTIEDEIIDKNGIDPDTLDLIALENDLLIAQIDYETTGKGKYKNKISRIKRRMKEIAADDEKKKTSVLESLLHTGGVLGYRLDPSTTTVAEYIEASKIAEDIVKKRKKQKNGAE